MDPTLKSVIQNYEGKINLAKVDVDELQDLAMEFNVSVNLYSRSFQAFSCILAFV